VSASDEKSTWLPNLVGGVSIWKLGADLNQERFFDGRLLEPEVEGADSLPTRVVWNVDRLVPLKDARASHPEDVRVAIEAFLGCVERVGKELSSSTSGFRKFKDAFSVPSLEGEGEASYFYDPSQKKLFVSNWGASPRSIAGKGEVVFGYEAFGALLAATRAGLGGAAAAPGAPAAAAVADGAATPAPATGAGDDKKAEEEKKKDEEKEDDDDKRRPVWVWILAVIVGIAIVVMLLFFLRECREREQAEGADAGPDAALDAGTDAQGDAAADAASDADAATDADVDAAADAATDAAADAEADAGADAAADAGADAEADAGDDGSDGTGETPAGGDGPPAGGDGSGDGKIYLVPGGIGPGVSAPPQGATGIPYRSHFQPGAKSWRITKGAKYLNRSLKPRMNRGSFEVFLEPGASFSQVQVEWKDPSGKWHVH
jgi:hypothetical protein